MINWPDTLVRDIALRKSVLVLGSGVSRNAVSPTGTKPPTWEEFLTIALNRIPVNNQFIKKLIREKDYLTACELIVAKLGEHTFHQVAEECFLTPGFQHHNIHQLIFQIDSKIVATPNVDKIYDTYAIQASRGTVVVKNYYDQDLPDKIRSRNKIIIKIHGTIDAPNEMIFTRKKYAEVRHKYPTIYEVLNALLLTNTFVFLGCGYSDPDIRLMLEKYTFCYPNCRPHYMVTPKEGLKNDLHRVLRESCNLELLTYSSQHDHRELVDSLSDLVSKVDACRIDIANAQEW